MLRLIMTIIAIIFLTSLSFARKGDEIIGKYRLPNKLDVEIFRENGKYYGKIIALDGKKDDQLKDVKNPDESKRNEPLLGKVIIEDLEFDPEEKKWVNGKMYGPEKGMTFNLKITEIKDDEIVVVGSKYIFWKTLVWKKL